MKDGDKYYRCHTCGSLHSAELINEDGKIKCETIILRNCRYVVCETTYYVADYNCFIWDEEHKCFKKYLPARHWW